jgi:hypothetical protein
MPTRKGRSVLRFVHFGKIVHRNTGIFFKSLTMEVVWILGENSMEIQFSY